MVAESNALNVKTIEYCYCLKCTRIKDISDLKSTAKGIQCRQCGGYDLSEAGWVACPYNKMTAVKCPTAGRGIVNTDSGLECMDRCFFRTSSQVSSGSRK